MKLASKASDGAYRPGYETIAAKIIEYIKTTGLQPGERLPTEQSLGSN